MQAVSESSSRSTSSDLLGGLFYWPQVDTKGSFHDHVPKEIATTPGAHRENRHPLQPDTAASSSAPVALRCCLVLLESILNHCSILSGLPDWTEKPLESKGHT